MNPVMEQLPESKRGADVESALSGLGVTDMGALADVLVSSHKLKGEAETMKGELEASKQKIEGALFIPGENATPEEVRAFNQKIGVPEASGYEIPETEGADRLREALSKAGIRKNPANVFVQELKTIGEEQAAQAAQAQQEKMDSYLASLGEDKDKVVNLAKRGAEILSQDSAVQTKLLSDPDLLPGLAKAGRASVESPKLFTTDPTGGAGELYPSMKSFD
jgi:hypothetical protein